VKPSIHVLHRNWLTHQTSNNTVALTIKPPQKKIISKHTKYTNPVFHPYLGNYPRQLWHRGKAKTRKEMQEKIWRRGNTHNRLHQEQGHQKPKSNLSKNNSNTSTPID
jgi:hypothetical protein